MEVLQTEDGKKGKFYILLNDVEIAKMEYVYAGPEKYIIEHTEVNEEHEGKGLGKELVAAGVEFARANNLKVLPLCPYAKAIFNRMKDYSDVLF